MTQLSDDCFRHGDALMPLDDALTLLEQRIAPVAAIESVPLGDTVGRILGEDLVATLDVPPFDNSAVDGYAVYYDDLAPGATTLLPVTGRVTAGHALNRPARRGEALRVFTGAAMPRGTRDAGPDTIFMQEDCEMRGDQVRLPPGIARHANRRRAGEDVTAGGTVLRRGRRLRPEDLGLAAALGRASLVVYRRLRVAVFSTGDEVREPGATLEAGTIYDSNRYVLTSLLTRLGCEVDDLGIIADDLVAVRDALADAAPDHDALITSGGASVGEEDHVKTALEALGRLTFWRLAIKPGRPLALGELRRTPQSADFVPFVGLPGNPVAVMVTFLRFVRPLILRLAGCENVRPLLFPVLLGFDHKKKLGRREFVRCRLTGRRDHLPLAERAGGQGAAILTSVSAADGFVELAEDLSYVAAGSVVDFLPFGEVA